VPVFYYYAIFSIFFANIIQQVTFRLPSIMMRGQTTSNNCHVTIYTFVSVFWTAMLMMSKSPITTEVRTMPIPNTIRRKIAPTHPGELPREDFMPDYDLTTTWLADALGVSRQTINELLRERRAISPVMALRLSRLFGNSPEFWLNAQHAGDLWESEQRFGNELSRIRPLDAAWRQLILS
jgi:addiction module HigA family antidote